MVLTSFFQNPFSPLGRRPRHFFLKLLKKKLSSPENLILNQNPFWPLRKALWPVAIVFLLIWPGHFKQTSAVDTCHGQDTLQTNVCGLYNCCGEQANGIISPEPFFGLRKLKGSGSRTLFRASEIKGFWTRVLFIFPQPFFGPRNYSNFGRLGNHRDLAESPLGI